MTIVGYTDRFSYQPGDTVVGMLGRAGPQLVGVDDSVDVDVVDVDVVRLLHGDTDPAGPGFRTEPVPGTTVRRVGVAEQQTAVGSFMHAPRVGPPTAEPVELDCWVWPTRPASGTDCGVLGLTTADGAPVLAVTLDGAGRAGLVVADGDVVVRLERPMLERRWYRIRATASAAGCELSAEPCDPVPGDAGPDRLAGPGVAIAAARDVVVAALALKHTAAGPRSSGNFDGKVERPVARFGPVTAGEWAFERESDSDLAVDVSGRGRHGRLVNMPARAMTGHAWNGDTAGPRDDPLQYGAVHFHADDMIDAGWAPGVRIALPDGLASGVYALRLRTGRGDPDHVPFVVAPPVDGPRAEIAVLLPSFTYAAYANLRPPKDRPVRDPHDHLLAAHPEFGSSTYDRHGDGSGVCYASLARPVLTLRPTYRSWLTGCPRHFGSDLSLLYWLRANGHRFDVITDHDLHAAGSAALDGYRVVVTGSHPEYCSAQMLDALDTYTRCGGCLMYLGGNGFYWVTSFRSGVVEVRRYGGTRTWDGEPGERHHAMTGEPGGLWRDRGRPPNALTGIGMTAQGWGPATGYRRTPLSFEPDWSWVFEGVPGDVVGTSGLVLGGASGDELDRCDAGRGSPPQTAVLASSLPHGAEYHAVVEDVLAVDGDLSGLTSPLVRSDMTITERLGGGAVFAVGSIAFVGSLLVDDGVATVVRNVLENFLARTRADRR